MTGAIYEQREVKQPASFLGVRCSPLAAVRTVARGTGNAERVGVLFDTLSIRDTILIHS